jgi:Protein of unknown function (DUF3147)
MKPTIHLEGLKRAKAWEYAVRFVFGGLVTAAAGLVADAYGPGIGGLMLAFPAILPASLTLVKRHDGREEAIDDARDARIGGVALIAFAIPIWLGAARWPFPLVLALATLAWTALAGGLWAVVYGAKA